MSILVNKDTRLLVQGITGREGQFHTKQMIEYGTQVVAGTAPGKGGSWMDNVPIFSTVKDAVAATEPNTSVIYVPAPFAADAIIEAADGGIKFIVCITEGIPVLDMIKAKAYLDAQGVRLLGPNCPGVISPGEAKVGVIPGNILIPGPVGVVSRSGTLTYEVVYALTQRGLGQSTAVGIGGDPVSGTSFVDVLQLFQDDPLTDLVALIGEIGGSKEEEAAAFIAEKMTKPVIALIAGQSAPADKRMGHAGAIVSGGVGSAQDKIDALQSVGVRIARHPEEVAELAVQMLS